MAKEIKKAQKSVQVDVVEKDVPATKPKATELPVAETTGDLSVIDARSDLDKKLNPIDEDTFSRPFKRLEGRRNRVSNITDKPILNIAGVDIELTKLEMEKTQIYGLTRQGMISRPYGYDNILAISRDDRNQSLPYNSNEKLSAGNTEWYTATYAGVEFVLSQGSELIVTDSLSAGQPWDYTELRTDPVKLTLLASTVECQFLNVVSNSSLNNTFIHSESLSLTKAMCAACYFNSNTNINLFDVDARSCNIYECKYLYLNSCYMENVHIHGPRNINLRNVKDRYNRFHFSLYCRQEMDLSIDCGLAEHAAWHSITSSMAMNDDSMYRNAELRIKRRIDYGTFSSQENIPFIRLNDVDMVVQGEVFFAKDFFPEYFGSPQKPSNNLEIGYNGGPFSPINATWAKFERGGELWEKAAKIAFPNSNIIGKNGHDLIKTLLDQIRSRIGLYVELHNLKE